MDQEAGEDAILIVLMKINIVSWNVRGLNDARKRQLIKSLLHTWKADVYCFQETKLQGDIRNIVRELWANRWVKYAQLEASGTRGGILILWDGRVWEGEICEVGAYCITCKFMGKTMDFSWHMSGVYAPNDREEREEREEVWWELASVRGLFSGPSVVGGDFNIVRFPSEKRNCTRFNKAMLDFSDFIEDMELADPQLVGDNFTWKRGERHDSAARLDRFLISEEWETSFRNIKQSTMHRVISDHCPLILECGNWEKSNSYFKFENWWLQTENFKEMVKNWWDSFNVRGRPDFILASKLRYLKDKLKEWSKTRQGNLGLQKQSILNQLAEFDGI
uniref:Endonuclease/exonuclease/phosphatase domain-containing protein n=1 Tax=Solanum tuberosum TaxID=4113 RepID=M1BT70_SOLTU